MKNYLIYILQYMLLYDTIFTGASFPYFYHICPELACGLKNLPLIDQHPRKYKHHLATSRITWTPCRRHQQPWINWRLMTWCIMPWVFWIQWLCFLDCCYGNRIEGVGMQVIKFATMKMDICFIKPGTCCKLDVLGIS